MTDSLSDAVAFTVGEAVLSMATNAGPRITAYSNAATQQLFAELPSEFIEHPDLGDRFHFIGGHRLWRAPEVPVVTYQADDQPVTIHKHEAGVKITGAPDGEGVVKAIRATPFNSMTVVDHTLRNEGPRPVTTAAWAITQLAPGGVGVIPQAVKTADVDGVLPNRSIVMWPYTDLADADTVLGVRDVRLRSTSRSSKAKVGTQNAMGWIAYFSRDALFVKWSSLHDAGLTYPDRGSSIECYRDHRFLELETLGPVVTLEPGDEVGHREVWQMIDVTNDSIDEVLTSLPTEPEAMGS